MYKISHMIQLNISHVILNNSSQLMYVTGNLCNQAFHVLPKISSHFMKWLKFKAFF